MGAGSQAATQASISCAALAAVDPMTDPNSKVAEYLGLYGPIFNEAREEVDAAREGVDVFKTLGDTLSESDKAEWRSRCDPKI